MDYLATGKLEIGTAEIIIKGIAEGCLQVNCALLGGETAELPGFYQKSEYDLSGFVVGMEVLNSIKNETVNIGDQLIGIPSNGLHSNGYSLVRKICFEKLKLSINSHVIEFGKTLGEELLKPTRIYASLVLNLLESFPVSGIAHITGSGIPGNVVRILPKSGKALLRKDSWQIPLVFDFLKVSGPVSDTDMMETFNNGLGLVMAISENRFDAICRYLDSINERHFHVGEVVKRSNNENQIEWV